MTSLPVLTPGGETGRAAVTRSAGVARARFEATAEPGVYRLSLPDPPGGFAYATVRGEPRGDDAAPLEPAEAARLAEGWPLHFETDPTVALPTGSSRPAPGAAASSGAASSSPPWAGSASRST